MEISVEMLKNSGGFVGAPVAKEISWKNGDETVTATTYVRRMSYKTVMDDALSAKRGIIDESLAIRIASCICDSAGNSVFTVEDITGKADPKRGPLSNELTMALLAAIAEVNSAGKLPKG